MKITTIQCSCDNCKEGMTELEYEEAVRVTIAVDLPHPQGKCGQHSGTTMRICSKCSELIGVVNSKEYHDYIYSQSRFTAIIESSKEKIFKLFHRNKPKEATDESKL